MRSINPIVPSIKSIKFGTLLEWIILNNDTETKSQIRFNPAVRFEWFQRKRTLKIAVMAKRRQAKASERTRFPAGKCAKSHDDGVFANTKLERRSEQSSGDACADRRARHENEQPQGAYGAFVVDGGSDRRGNRGRKSATVLAHSEQGRAGSQEVWLGEKSDLNQHSKTECTRLI